MRWIGWLRKSDPYSCLIWVMYALRCFANSQSTVCSLSGFPRYFLQPSWEREIRIRYVGDKDKERKKEHRREKIERKQWSLKVHQAVYRQNLVIVSFVRYWTRQILRIPVILVIHNVYPLHILQLPNIGIFLTPLYFSSFFGAGADFKLELSPIHWCQVASKVASKVLGTLRCAQL